MSCSSSANRISALLGKISGGISQLSSKQAFYAGLSLGAAGVGLGSALVARFRRRGEQRKTVIGRRPPTKPTLRKLDLPPKDGDQAGPKQLKLTPKAGGDSRPKKLKMRPRSKPQKLNLPPKPAAGPVKLVEASVTMQVGQGQQFSPSTSYRVTRPDGGETGLALTPYVRTGEDGRLIEAEGQWGLTHLRSGALVSGPHPLKQAQQLAGDLSGLSWSPAAMPPEEVSQARQIIQGYRS